MLVSVVVPVYNCIEVLEATIAGIQGSGLSDYELLLIDDGSTDGTGALCDRLAERNPGLCCIHQPNGGVSAARNRGIEEAQGDYILFFDADDTVDAGSLTDIERQLRESAPDMLIFGLSFDYYFHGRLYRREELIFPKEGLWTGGRWRESFGELFRYNVLSPVWNKLIRRELLLEKNIRFLGSLIEMEDFLFSVQCLAHCEKIYLLPRAIYRYRQPENEKNTFRRLCRIESLSAYMSPFYHCLEQVAEGDEKIPAVADEIYLIFLRELTRFGAPERIRRTAEDLLSSGLREMVQYKEPVLYGRLESKQYYRIWLGSRLSLVRHWVAVRVKYLRSFGRQ